MPLLSYNELCRLVEDNVITGVDPMDINATSIDVHLGDKLIIESDSDNIVDIAQRSMWASVGITIANFYYDLRPGEFVLAATREIFNLPSDISAEFRLKSSGARSGLNNLFACHCDPGWHGSALTLELKNELRHHSIRLTHGMPIGQMLFHRVAPVPKERSYATIGRYNKDTSAQGVKL
jgi:dCTP deaminase